MGIAFDDGRSAERHLLLNVLNGLNVRTRCVSVDVLSTDVSYDENEQNTAGTSAMACVRATVPVRLFSKRSNRSRFAWSND